MVYGLSVLVVSVFAYSVWLSRKLSKVTDGLCRLTARDYTQIKEKELCPWAYGIDGWNLPLQINGAAVLSPLAKIGFKKHQITA